VTKPPIAKVGRICHYCGDRATTRDHIVPKILGGTNGLFNLVPCCTRCNRRKGADWPVCDCDKCQTAVLYMLTGERPSLHA